MYLIVLYLLWHSGVEVVFGNIAIASVCCPIGWSLLRVKGSSKYDCVSETQRINETTELFAPTQPIFGYLIQKPSDNITNIPLCDDQRLTIFPKESVVHLTSNFCLTSLANQVIIISCPEENGDREVQLRIVHKCCPVNHIYSSIQRMCIKHESTFDVYSTLFRHAIVLISDPIDCPRDKVLMEYHLAADMFRFDGSHLVLHTKKIFEFNEYCVEASMINGVNMSNFIVRTCEDVSVCKRLPCIRRCCADGEMFVKGNATSYCRKDESDISFHSFESLNFSGNFSKPADFGILRSLDCRKFRLDPDTYLDEAHKISERDGSLYVTTTHRNYSNSEYCTEKIRNSTYSDQKLYTFLCFDSKVVGNDRIRFKLYPIGLLISCCFYLITLLVYLSVSKLRNLPGKILICLVTSLLSAYLAIALGQLMPNPNDDVCFTFGFFVYFCLMAAFAWMNITCFDIWQTFGSTKKRHGFKQNHTKQFILYSLYGWGLPSIFTTITVSLTKSNILNEKIRPHFGHGRCWFTYDIFASASLVFFSGPVGILFLINFFLFSLTLHYCNKVKREIFRMQSSNMEKPVLRRRFFMDKARFAMNTKLCFVMGITWLLELLSIIFYEHKNTFFWAISDSFNVLLGVFVFFIFVCKKRIWHSILEMLGLRSKSKLKHGPNATCATQSTSMHGKSMTHLNGVERNSAPHTPYEAQRFSPIMTTLAE